MSMKENKIKNFYNSFHKSSSFQQRIISKKNFTYRGIIHEILKLSNQSNFEILDYGCGVGTLSLFLSSLGNIVIGLDISDDAVNIAKKNLELIDKNLKVTFYNIETGNKIISKIKFDLIMCIEVIEHVPDELKLLKFLEKKLKKDGRIIVSVPSYNSPLYRLGLLTNFDSKVGHIRRYNIKELKTLFSCTSLVIEKVVKTEGFIRNSLFVFPILNFTIKFLKGIISDIVTFIDNIFVCLLGESNIIIIARKK